MPKRAFTLIELLMVIALVAVIVAALMPSLARARAGARVTAGVAQMRSLGHRLIADADDHAGVFLNPFATPQDADAAGDRWADAILRDERWSFEALDNPTAHTEFFAYAWASYLRLRDGESNWNKSILSPADATLLQAARQRGADERALHPSSFLYSPTFWTKPERYLDSARAVMTPSMLARQRMDNVLHPIAKVLVWERADFRQPKRRVIPDVSGNFPPAWNNHASSVHVMTCDGSVTDVKMFDLMSRSVYANLCQIDADASLYPGGTIAALDNPPPVAPRAGGASGYTTMLPSDEDFAAFFWATQKGVQGRDLSR
jgi:prepilin-type N-terminal cleavage/methylation domain-containing protein